MVEHFFVRFGDENPVSGFEGGGILGRFTFVYPERQRVRELVGEFGTVGPVAPILVELIAPPVGHLRPLFLAVGR